MHIRLFIGLLFLGSASLLAQNVTVSGYVKEARNGEALIGVSVYTTSPRYGVVTNAYGFYSLTLPKGEYELNYSFIGYSSEKVKIDLKKNTVIDMKMSEEAVQLEEATVMDRKLDENLKTPEMGVQELSAKEISRIPQFLGEVDIVRTLTLLPGVSTVGEGANGFNVRGGNVDQNLILIDEAPVFNSSHLFGFFSIFNGDAVKDVKLYKGGMPAQYGGRLSSVLDIRQKDGNNQQFAGNGGLGLLSTRIMLEAPIVKDKVSFMVAGRRSYQDVFLRLSSDPEINQTTLYFYDFNAKVNYIINDRNRLYLSGYYGRDVFGAQDLFNFGWGNGTGTLRWNFIATPKLFMNTTLVYSDYSYNLGVTSQDISSFNWDSRIRNYVGKVNFTLFANTRHKVSFGGDATYYVFDPGIITGPVNAVLQKEYALEPGVYMDDEWTITENITVLGGLRYSWFYNMGQRTIQLYEPGQSLRDEHVIGTNSYNQNEVIASYTGLGGLEPRLSANWRVNKKTSLKFSYNRNRQYIHLISNRTTPTPIDVWRPAGKYIKPATVNQIAAGVFRNFKEGTYKVSVEGYYKIYENLVDYKNGANLIFEDNIETELLSGQGLAYGLEFMIEKQVGAVTGWLSYTLSRSRLQVDKGETPDEWINNGEWYLTNYDKTHDLSLVLAWRINKKWDLGANFVYQTGRPMTPPESKAVYENGIIYPITIDRNSQRVPAYHRLDLSATYYLKKKNPDKRWEHNINFGIYNAYARKNAYSIFFRQNEETGIGEAVRLSIFATAIPFITYNFKF